MMNKQEEIEAPMKEVAEFLFEAGRCPCCTLHKTYTPAKGFQCGQGRGLANPSYKDCVKRNLCPILGIGEMKMRMQVYRGLG